MNKNQETERGELTRFLDELQLLKKKDNFRTLPTLVHQGKEVIIGGQRMLNLSSNDYLGLANDSGLLKAFWQTVKPEEIKFSPLLPACLPAILPHTMNWKLPCLPYLEQKRHWYSIADIMPIPESYLPYATQKH